MHVRREPAQLSDATVQPVLFTVLFVYIFGAAMVIPGGTYKQFAIAGLVVFNITTSTMGTAVGVSSDLKSGVIDRFRTLPMARSAILAGRTFSDLLASILCATIVVITGFVIGWRPDNGIPGVVAGLADRGAVRLRDELAHGVRRPVGQRPGVGPGHRAPGPVPDRVRLERDGADAGPARLDAAHRRVEPGVGRRRLRCRELFGNPNPAALTDNFPSQNPVLMSIIWSVVILAVCIPIARARLKARTVD